VDVRIIGSTNANLRFLAADGRFREDLLDRMAFDVITVPPLRERLDDILPLAYAFAVNMVSEMQCPYFPGFTARASSSLLRRTWPGNVRELKNAIERSVYRHGGKETKLDRIAFDPFDSPFSPPDQAITKSAQINTEFSPGSPLLPTDLKAAVNETEKRLLQAGLEKARFNQRVAADLLGLSYHQLRGKIKKHQLNIR
jgi:psp operon transcriptional activator